MRRAAAVLLGLVLLLSACGRESSLVLDLTAGEPVATPAPAPAPTRAPAAAPGGDEDTNGQDPEPEPTPEPTPEPAEPPPPPPPANPGDVNRPRPGTYVYDVSGEAHVRSPLNPGGSPERIEGEQRRTAEVEGDIYTWTTTSDAQQGATTTTHERWLPDRVELLYFAVDIPGLGRYECAFDPPIRVMNLPLSPGAIPTQTISGAGNACEGSVDIEVIGQTSADDAGGRSWPVWEVDVSFEARGEGFETAQDDKQFLSPELGVSVRSQGQGTFAAQSGAFEVDGTTESQTALKQRP